MIYYVGHHYFTAVTAINMILMFLVFGPKLILSVEGIKTHLKSP